MFKLYIKQYVSFCVYSCDRLLALFTAIIGVQLSGKCTVLCYHSIKPHEIEKFRAHLRIIDRNAITLPADFKGRLKPGKHYVVLTFDDGFKSVLNHALPVLSEFKIPAALFLVTDFLGRSPQSIDDKVHPDIDEPILSIEDLVSLKNDLITIGSHSVSHPYMTLLPESEARRELTESKKMLNELTGTDISLFAFPHGDHNETLIDLAHEAGYQRVFTLSHKPAFSTDNEFATGRVDVYMDESLFDFELKLLGAYRWLSSAFRIKRKLSDIISVLPFKKRVFDRS